MRVQSHRCPLKKVQEDEKFKKLMKDNKREIVMWESEEAAKKVQMASEAYGAFLKEIGFVKQ